MAVRISHVKSLRGEQSLNCVLVCRKKLSNFTKSKNWKHASNHVAKQYINEVPRKVYFDDVILQMDAKLWGEEYNRHYPPKKVSVIMVGGFDTFLV